MESLLKVRLDMKNLECLERYDDLVVRLRGIIEGLKEVHREREKNYQALINIYEEFKEKIDLGVYNAERRDMIVSEFSMQFEDFYKRFGSEIDYDTRHNFLDWLNTIKKLDLGGMTH